MPAKAAAPKKRAARKPKKTTVMGRPTKYSPKLIPAVKALVLRGLTDVEIAQTLGIGVRTLYDWRVAHEEFSQTLRRSKNIVNEQVEATYVGFGSSIRHLCRELGLDPPYIGMSPLTERHAPTQRAS
jgi:hypothetical protein